MNEEKELMSDEGSGMDSVEAVVTTLEFVSAVTDRGMLRGGLVSKAKTSIVLVGVMILATTVMVSGFVPVASVGIDPIIELAFLSSGWVSLNWIN